MKSKYDLIIIGGGPAGLTAAIYAARYKLKTVVISKDFGLAASAHKVCNFPSYKDVNGLELMQKFTEHVKDLEVPIVYDKVIGIRGVDGDFVVETSSDKYIGKKVLFSGGTIRKKLGLINEQKLTGKGISYCATCDAPFFKDKIVAVIGGSDAALTSALLLAEYAKKVYLIYRKNQFRAEPTWIESVEINKKIKKMFNEEVNEVKGEDVVEGVKLKSGRELNVQGVFIEVGSIPEVEFLNGLNVKLDNKEYIIADEDQNTSVKGFFAAGDVTNSKLKQIITAASQGAVAAYSVYREIKEQETEKPIEALVNVKDRKDE